MMAVDLFARARESYPELEASVLAATIGAGPQGLVLRRGLSPAKGGEHTPVALVVRLEDTLHGLWDARGADGMAADLGALEPISATVDLLATPDPIWASWGNGARDEFRFLYPFYRKSPRG